MKMRSNTRASQFLRVINKKSLGILSATAVLVYVSMYLVQNREHSIVVDFQTLKSRVKNLNLNNIDGIFRQATHHIPQRPTNMSPSNDSEAANTNNNHHNNGNNNNNSSNIDYSNKNSNDEELPACVFLKVDPFDPEVMKISGLDQEARRCQPTLPDLIFLKGRRLTVDLDKVNKSKSAIGDLKQCRMSIITRNPGHENAFLESDWQTFKEFLDLPDDVEFVKAECLNSKDDIISKNYFTLIPKKAYMNELESVRMKKWAVETGAKETLNVIMIGIDTLPRQHMMRSLTKTYSYLVNTLNAFDMSMHSQIGYNTYPNFLPLFTGHSEAHIDKFWDRDKYVDAFDLVWRHYEAAGYRTLHTEDWPEIGGFHHLKKGFQFPSVLYNSRPLAVAMDKDKKIWNSKKQCIGSRPELCFHLDYLGQFLDAFPHKPIFALMFNTKLCHENVPNAKTGDEHLYTFFKSIHDKGHLNKSMLIFFSDHGPTWGGIRGSKNGVVEGKSPFTLFRFPEWFLQKYPQVAQQLRTNTERLTSHYDTHATLLDLLYFKANGTPPVLPPVHGISLFQEIPRNRTCQDASIPQEYCLCGRRDLESLDVKQKASGQLAKLVVQKVNSLKDDKLCVTLKLKKLLSIVRVHLPDAFSKEHQNMNLLRVKLQTVPGDAVYEASVSYFNDSRTAKVSHEIERLNLYRGQAECVQDAKMRPFCYCQNLPTSSVSNLKKS